MVTTGLYGLGDEAALATSEARKRLDSIATALGEPHQHWDIETWKHVAVSATEALVHAEQAAQRHALAAALLLHKAQRKRGRRPAAKPILPVPKRSVGRPTTWTNKHLRWIEEALVEGAAYLRSKGERVSNANAIAESLKHRLNLSDWRSRALGRDAAKVLSKLRKRFPK
jgi:hypothetical protein